MSRPMKDGVDYFNKDCDFYQDEKVRLLRAEYGAKGMYLLDYLLCEIYGKTGYYIRWDDKTCYLVSDGAGCGLTPGFVAEFVAGCIRCSFFDERVASAFGVLTSAGIQRRYIRMIEKRETAEFMEDYFLLDVNSKKDIPAGSLAKVAFKKITSPGNQVKVPENPEKVGNNTQSKVKESKYNTHTIHAPARVSEEAEEQEETLSLPDEAEITAEFRKMKLKEPEAEAKAFAEYNSRNGWKGDWKLKAELWARRATKKAYNVARTKEKNEKSSFDIDAFFEAACKATYGSLDANGGGEIGKKET